MATYYMISVIAIDTDDPSGCLSDNEVASQLRTFLTEELHLDISENNLIVSSIYVK
jgi:hypothetical protein